MQSEINPRLLKPHPKNAEYYADLPAEKYQEVKRSVQAHGIRDSLKILPDFTVLAGHQRLKIALELGLDRVPVEIKDVPPEEAEYHLIADNEERRQADEDPIRKARRAKFLAEYWGVKRGGDRRSINQNGELKTAKDVAKAVGVDAPHLPRLLKLNDLIPELQSLVSAGKLGTTAAEQLAYLTPEVQADLFRAMGDSLADLSVPETKGLRKQLEEREAEKARLAGELEQARGEAKTAEEKAAGVKAELAEVNRELADLRDKVEDLKEEARGEALKKTAELEGRLAKLSEEKKKADTKLRSDAEVILDLNAKLKEIERAGIVDEKPVRYAEDIQRIQQLEGQVQEKDMKIKELQAKPPQVVERVPEKVQAEIKSLKTEKSMLLNKLKEVRNKEEELQKGYQGRRKAVEKDAVFSVSKIIAFLEDISHLTYTAREIMNCDLTIQNDYCAAIESLEKWCRDMLNAMPRFSDDIINISKGGVIIDVTDN